MLIAFVRTYFVDVTYQVSSKETSDRYYSTKGMYHIIVYSKHQTIM